jgi:hypothetical protein
MTALRQTQGRCWRCQKGYPVPGGAWLRAAVPTCPQCGEILTQNRPAKRAKRALAVKVTKTPRKRRGRPGKKVCWFGEYKGLMLKQLPRTYITWLAGSVDPDKDSPEMVQFKGLCRAYLRGTEGR